MDNKDQSVDLEISPEKLNSILLELTTRIYAETSALHDIITSQCIGKIEDHKDELKQDLKNDFNNLIDIKIKGFATWGTAYLIGLLAKNLEKIESTALLWRYQLAFVNHGALEKSFDELVFEYKKMLADSTRIKQLRICEELIKYHT